ncbi:MAG: hypothetical protein HQL48_11040 [Gammaproteobacteria bacterium]|nr:hypothetical protein [Gammaproteobacteria bacterium]
MMIRKRGICFNPLLGGLLISALLLGGCSNGDDDSSTSTTPDTSTTDTTTTTDTSTATTMAKAVEPESCVVCHSDAGMANHQAEYDKYADASTLTLAIDSVASTANGDGTFTSVMTFTITQDGMAYPYSDLSRLNQKRFYAMDYDSATGRFGDAGGNGSTSRYREDTAVSLGGGKFTVTAPAIPFAPEQTSAEVYGYIGTGVLETEGMTLYSDIASAGKSYNGADSYTSPANVAGCEKCHGTPYMKHGYREAKVGGLADFAACKTCHYDNRNGGHEDWQILVDNPLRYAEIAAGSEITTAEETQYAYKANLMNDVHMSHAMEFPYPQSMANCATCHEGKLATVLSDDNFVYETCKSCHAVNGDENYTDSHRAPALKAVWNKSGFDHESVTGSCNNSSCHKSGGVSGAPTFSEIHSGYNSTIYADGNGTRYSDLFTVTIDEAYFSSNNLNVKFSATKKQEISTLNAADIVPTLLVGLYGYNTKDFIVAAHGRDDDGNRLLEFQIDGVTENPRFTVVAASGGMWEVNVDLSMWSSMIADGSIKRAEIGVMPALGVVGTPDSRSNGESDDKLRALDAPSRTYDLSNNVFDDSFFSDIVKVDGGCNVCHDALSTTFHSPNRSGNITICRICHVGSSGGSHLEMQSRSIDSYVHAVHSFQAFDTDDVDFTDPVEAVHYDHHVEHTYPNFTIKNCESCHNPGTYEVPDQSKSMPGILSGSYEVTGRDRNIGTVASVVTGPGARACGACHRAHAINEDDAGKLIALNQHTSTNGYKVENDDGVWDSVVKTIMTMFQ